MTAKVKEHVNINTFFLAILVGLSGWTLKTLSELSTASATTAVRVEQHDRDIKNLDARVRDNTNDITRIRIDSR